MAATSVAAAMLSSSRWLVAGDVLNSSKPASRIVQRLRDNGREVHLVNPRHKASAGDAVVHATLASALDAAKPSPVALGSAAAAAASSAQQAAAAQPVTVDLVINPMDGFKLLSDLPDSARISLFVQPGAESAQILQLAKERGWPTHEGCVLIEMPAPSKL